MKILDSLTILDMVTAETDGGDRGTLTGYNPPCPPPSHSPCPFHLLRISGTSPCICPHYSTATILSVQFQLILFLPVLLS